MSDRLRDAADELRERWERDTDETAVVSGRDLSSSPGLEALNATLHSMFPRGVSPWLELWCDQHPTGAAVRVVAKGGPGVRLPEVDGRVQPDWMLEPMVRPSVPPVTQVGMWEVDRFRPDDDGMPAYRQADTPAPERWQVVCGRCRAVRRFLPGRLDDLVPRALIVWAQRRESGRHGRPRVVLPGATA